MPGASSEPRVPTVTYRGRIAPTPTGHLHLGHARAFGFAWARAREAGGRVVYRTEDLDPHRCKAEFETTAMADLRWLGLDWDEGPDTGGPHSPYRQSERTGWFREVWALLQAAGVIYPSPHSRKDVAEAAAAPHDDGGEPIFPPELRAPPGAGRGQTAPGEMNWRFRVPDGQQFVFTDVLHGRQSFTAGVDFGDFLVWRRDGVPAYELAVVADDHAMEISEVVRGADLLLSTARQLLLYEALDWQAPAWCHVPLVRDEQGNRLAKRHQSLSLQAMRTAGADSLEIRDAQIAACRP